MRSTSRASRESLGSLSSVLPVLVLAMGLAMHLYSSMAVCAQAVERSQTDTLLQKSIHLRLGQTTLLQTLQEISKQTGLQIQAADYLEERELLVEMDHVSALVALDTLAEGNGWTWAETKPGQIVMSRPKFDKTQQLTNVAPAFRAIVPKDLRRYTGLDLSEDEARSVIRTKQPKEAAFYNSPAMILFLQRTGFFTEPLERALSAQERAMTAWATEDVRTGQKIPYASLTPERQQALINRFVLTAMQRVSGLGAMGTADLLRGLDPTELDEKQLWMMEEGNVLVFGTPYGEKHGKRSSFGEGWMSEKQLPNPLFQHTKF